ncbi:MAG: polysaccharide biosynthesis C-terminal domain-containing protein [Bacteroidaceae bacterium]|nr:polysaccharide biosynthesis C-terminal domain-containing protein [Bacteroidaceae bacterium]
MANLKALAKDTAIYGLSSIVGRFLNYLLVPLYTAYLSVESGGYGVVTNMYAYTALILVILTCGMETTFFRFANKEEHNSDLVFSTALGIVTLFSTVFMLLVLLFLPEVSSYMKYSNHPEYVWMMALTVSLDSIQAVPFSFLRFEKKAMKFAALKMLFIILNILLNLIYFCLLPWLGKHGIIDSTEICDPSVQVAWIFRINLICTSIITFFFWKEFKHITWHIDFRLLKDMMKYTLPLIVLGIAGILNQTLDKQIFPQYFNGTSEEAMKELGIYGACVKIAFFIVMFTQAFRYAYEPLVFANSKDKDAKETYALGMKWFIISTLLGFLLVMGYLDILQYIIRQEEYRVGLKVVPIVMAAEIMMGIFFNLSFWYKLIDKTIWGAWFSIVGCVIIFALNALLIPKYSYMACAWAGLIGYACCMLLSYFVGQKKNPINYPLKEIGTYTLLASFLYFLMEIVPDSVPTVFRILINTALISLFFTYLVKKDLPLKNLPYIGKYFNK